MKSMSKEATSMKFRILKIIILAIVLYAVVRMWHWPIGFTYFTQLSNLFIGAVVFLQLAYGTGKLCALKYAATVSILITFFVYLTVLGMMVPGGLWEAYRQDHYASLCMHLLVPFLSLVDFLLNDRVYYQHRRWRVHALLPPIVWYVFILVLSLCGLRWNGMAAPYPFLNYTAPAGWLGFLPGTFSRSTMGIGVFYSLLAMLGLFLLIGFLLQRACVISRKKG